MLTIVSHERKKIESDHSQIDGGRK